MTPPGVIRAPKAPTEAELTRLTHALAHRIGRYLERQGLLERDAENSYLMGDDLDSGPMAQLQGASITYRKGIWGQSGNYLNHLGTDVVHSDRPLRVVNCRPTAFMLAEAGNEQTPAIKRHSARSCERGRSRVRDLVRLRQPATVWKTCPHQMLHRG